MTMRRKYVFLVMLVLSVVGLGVSLGKLFWPTVVYEKTDRFLTPAWVEYDDRNWLRRGCLFVRCTSADCRHIWMRHLDYEEFRKSKVATLGSGSESNKLIYEFSPTALQPRALPSVTWDSVDSVIIECLAQYAAYPKPFETEGHKLRFHGKVTPIAGKSILRAAISEDGKYMALLTAAGSARFVGLPFLGGYKSPGARIHQAFRMADGQPVGEPIILSDASMEHDISPCWSPENRYVVYTDAFLTEMWIIPFVDEG